MERLLGLRFGGGDLVYDGEHIAICSLASRVMLWHLMDNCPVTFSQLLYPYADALSLSGKNGTESTQIFGTHLILRGVEEVSVAAALADGLAAAAERGWEPDVIVHHFYMADGCAAAAEIAAFLACRCEGETVGDFGGMLGGFVPHWRIREAAKVFASFSEMTYRLTKGGVYGLAGGKLLLHDGLPTACIEKVRTVCFQKTASET